MGNEFMKYYEQGLGYQRLGDYYAAAECFKKATLLDKNRPEAWYEAGFSLIQVQRLAEAGMYLRRALAEYEQAIELSLQKDYNYYQKACVLALLNETQAALAALEMSLSFNPTYAEMALQSLAFANIKQEEEFQRILIQPLNKLMQMRHKGQKMKQSEFSALDWLNRQKFLTTLQQEGWKTEAYADLWENDHALAPQAAAYYDKNPALVMRLSYYLDENLVFMELQGRNNEENSQDYRVYIANKPDSVLEVITRFQNQVSFENWEDFMEELIEVCKSLLFEMPDGRKVKVS